MGTMPAPGIRPMVGLMPDESAHRRRRDDAAIGFGAHCRGAQAGGDRGSRSGTRSRRIAVQAIRIARLPSASAPSAGGMAGAIVGPFAQISLAQDDGARVAQAGDQRGVFGSWSTRQRERAGSGHHFVGGIDVVLNKDRDAVEGAARPFFLALAIERGGNGGCVRIKFDDGVDFLVDVGDARFVLLDQDDGGESPGGQARSEVGERSFFQIGRFGGSACGSQCGGRVQEISAGGHTLETIISADGN